jgi:hypothetical protein
MGRNSIAEVIMAGLVPAIRIRMPSVAVAGAR